MLYDPKWKPVEVKLEKWQTILLKAADIIEERGWVRGDMQRGGGYCLVGAIQMAAIGHTEALDSFSRDRNYGAAMERIEKNLGGEAWRWNDRGRRTKKEVVRKLREVAHVV